MSELLRPRSVSTAGWTAKPQPRSAADQQQQNYLNNIPEEIRHAQILGQGHESGNGFERSKLAEGRK